MSGAFFEKSQRPRASLRVIMKLKALRETAAFERASFGDSKVVWSPGYGRDPVETTLDALCKEETRLYRQSWVLPAIDQLIAWAEGEEIEL
jgi:hypothetical protein